MMCAYRVSPQFLYHRTAIANRSEIERNGLSVDCDRTGYAAVFLSESPGTECRGFDVWRVDAHGLELHDDFTGTSENGDAWYMSFSSIPADRLVRFEKHVVAARNYKSVSQELAVLMAERALSRESDTRILNRYYDALQKANPMWPCPEDLENEGKRVEALCSRRNLLIEAKRAHLLARLNEALEACGQHFGACASQELEGSVGNRVRESWGRASQWRIREIDGIALGGALSGDLAEIDPDGPCFKAFARALGYAKPKKLYDDICLECGIREGWKTAQINSDECKRLGIAEVVPGAQGMDI